MIARRSTFPRSPIAKAPRVVAAGPAMNLNTIPSIVSDGPHAIAFSCSAMNNPVINLPTDKI